MYNAQTLPQFQMMMNTTIRFSPFALLSSQFCLICLLSAIVAVGQTPPPPTVATAAMNAGLQCLKEGEWQQANDRFDTALRLAPTYAPAYIGKLCAQLQVTEEKLRDEYLSLIEGEEFFKKALENADAAYKKQIQGYADAIVKRREKELGNTSDRSKEAHKPGERMVVKIQDVEYAFHWCPVGSFMMGSPQGETGRQDNETLHRVTLSKGFWMLETPVTQMMWVSVMGTEPSRFKGDLLKLPVEQVSWNDCQEYIKKLNDLKVAPAGFKFALPTEAQWEYACRADTTTAYHFGDTLTKEQANFGGNKTTEVGKYPANAWGLKDMHGNVWEWCADWYDNYPSGTVTDPTGASQGSYRVSRGGSWDFDAEDCRSAFRYLSVPSYRYFSIGIRLSLVSQ
jgi:formylglycine-generating enzyme required for sulfatase activity